jgi:di/tricarboxylate transporter
LLAVTGASISLAFFTGAVAMVLVRVMTIQEVYQAIEWKVVFLLAGLIPLGIAMQKTGTARRAPIENIRHMQRLGSE